MVVVACMALSAHDRQRAADALRAAPPRQLDAGGSEPMGPLVVFVRRAARRADPDGGLRLRAHHLGLPAARLDRPDQLLRRRQLRAGPGARPLLAARPSLRRGRGPGRRLRRSGSTRCCCPACSADAAGRPRRCRTGCRRRSPTSIRWGRASWSASWSTRCCWSACRCWCARAGADAEQADAFVLGAEPEPPARADAGRCASASPSCASCWRASSAPSAPSARCAAGRCRCRRRWRRPSACCRAPWVRRRRA